MERKPESCGSVPLEPSLTDLVLKTKCGKVRRPPNAFMIFAREHRKLLAKQHPDVSNKAVSSMLGKLWKSTSEAVKKKYFHKAKLIGDLHKQRYPGYVYSPREARLQKMKKIKKKEENLEMNNEDLTAVIHLQEQEGKPHNEEEWPNNISEGAKSSSPGYVPNNPEFFARQSPSVTDDDSHEPEIQPSKQCPMQCEYIREETAELQKHQTHSQSGCHCSSSPPERCACCYPNRKGFRSRFFSTCEKDNEDVHPSSVDYLPRSSPTLSFYNPTRHFTQSLGPIYRESSYPASVPRTYRPPFHPYWNVPPVNVPYYPPRDYAFENELKPYPLPTSYSAHSSDYYPPLFGYFERPFMPMKSSLNSQGIGHMGEHWDDYRQKIARDDYEIRNERLPNYYKERKNGAEKLSSIYTCNSVDENATYQTNYGHSDSKSREIESEMANSRSSSDRHAVNKPGNQYPAISEPHVHRDVPGSKMNGMGFSREHFSANHSSSDFTRMKMASNTMAHGSGECASSGIASPDSTKITYTTMGITEPKSRNTEDVNSCQEFCTGPSLKFDESCSNMINEPVLNRNRTFWDGKKISRELEPPVEGGMYSSANFATDPDFAHEKQLHYIRPPYARSSGNSLEADSTDPEFVQAESVEQSKNLEAYHSVYSRYHVKQEDVNTTESVQEEQYNGTNERKQLISDCNKVPGMKIRDVRFDRSAANVYQESDPEAMEDQVTNYNTCTDKPILVKSETNFNALRSSALYVDQMQTKCMMPEDSANVYSQEQNDEIYARQALLPNFSTLPRTKFKNYCGNTNVNQETENESRKTDKTMVPIVGQIVKLEK